MRNKYEWDNPQYIVNLAITILGKVYLGELKGSESITKPSQLREILFDRVMVNLYNMSSETLGRICGYGTLKGFHSSTPLSSVTGFINRTGVVDLGGLTFKNGCIGRDALEEMAALTIICIAYDIIHQENWEWQRAEELELDQSLDRAEHQMTHPNRYR